MAKQKKQAEPIPLDELFVTFREKVTALSSSKAKSLTIWGIVVSVVLITGSSLLFYFNLFGSWLPALIGSPAGVILFLIGLGVVYRTQVGEWSIFGLRERLSFRQRIRSILIWFAVYAVIFVPFGGYVPYGIGGAILISLVLTSVATGRRSDEEIRLAQAGLPDPRDIAEAEAKDEYSDVSEGSLNTEETPEADTVYYDEQRGGVGGKLG